MTNGIGNLPTTPTGGTTTLPVRTPGASGHQAALRSGDNDGPVIPKIPGPRQPSALGPRPAPPAKPLTARPLSRDIDWNGHVPTAPRGPVSMTRAQVSAELARVEADEPRERVYDSIVLGYGIPAWQTAFGGAA